MNMKGTPSNRMLKNEIEKSCRLNVNQLITRQYRELRKRNSAQTENGDRKWNGEINPERR